MTKKPLNYVSSVGRLQFFICPSTTNRLIHQATMASVTIFLLAYSLYISSRFETNKHFLQLLSDNLLSNKTEIANKDIYMR